MVRIALAIGKGVDDTRSIRDMVASTKKTSIPWEFQGQGGGYQGQGRVGASDDMLSLSSAWAHETGLSIEEGIPELLDSAVIVISGTT